MPCKDDVKGVCNIYVCDYIEDQGLFYDWLHGMQEICRGTQESQLKCSTIYAFSSRKFNLDLQIKTLLRGTTHHLDPFQFRKVHNGKHNMPPVLKGL